MKRSALLAATLLLCLGLCLADGDAGAAGAGTEEEMDLFAPLHGSPGYAGTWVSEEKDSGLSFALYDGGYAEMTGADGALPMNWTEEGGRVVLTGSGLKYCFALTEDSALRDDESGERFVKARDREAALLSPAAGMEEAPEGRWELFAAVNGNGSLFAGEEGAAALVFEGGQAFLLLNGGKAGPFSVEAEAGQARLSAGGVTLEFRLHENGMLTTQAGGFELWFAPAARDGG